MKTLIARLHRIAGTPLAEKLMQRDLAAAKSLGPEYGKKLKALRKTSLYRKRFDEYPKISTSNLWNGDRRNVKAWPKYGFHATGHSFAKVLLQSGTRYGAKYTEDGFNMVFEPHLGFGPVCLQIDLTNLDPAPENWCQGEMDEDAFAFVGTIPASAFSVYFDSFADLGFPSPLPVSRRVFPLTTSSRP